MKIVPRKFDVGDILAQKEVPIGDEMLMPVLHDQLANIGAQLLIDCIKNLNNLKPIQQDNSQASYGKLKYVLKII
jgi:methionyl-tRNA formyltransferase